MPQCSSLPEALLELSSFYGFSHCLFVYLGLFRGEKPTHSMKAETQLVETEILRYLNLVIQSMFQVPIKHSALTGTKQAVGLINGQRQPA